MSDAGLIVWTQLWQVTLAVLIVGCISMRWGRRYPHFVYLLWMMVIVKTLIPPVWSSPAGMFSWLETAAASWTSDESRVASASHHSSPTLLPIEELSYDTGAATVWTPPTETPSEEMIAAQAPPTAPISQTWRSIWSSVNLWPVLMAIWLIGCAVLLLGAAKQWWHFYRVVSHSVEETPEWMQTLVERVRFRLGLRRRFRVVVNSAGIGPLVHGFLRPILVIPQELCQVDRRLRLEPVIAHEMIHARRGDTLFATLQFVSQIAWWFHPLVWWANRQANRSCEQCCDEEVIGELACRPDEYAHSLLDVLELKNNLRAVPGLAGMRSSQVTARRLNSLIRRNSPFPSRPPRWQWGVLFICGALMIPGGRLTDEWHIWSGSGNEVATDDSSPAAEKNRFLALRACADKDFFERQWSDAAQKYEVIVDEAPGDAMAWFRLGYARHVVGHLEQAIEAHRHAAQFAETRPIATYNWACALSLQGHHEDALEKLIEAVDVGFRAKFPIQNDPDLEALIDHPEFKVLVEKTVADVFVEGQRQLDFWVGSWNVFSRDNQLLGTSEISRAPSGLALNENFKGQARVSGTGFSYFDPDDQLWRQTWVESNGEIVQYEGGYRNGKLLFEGKISNTSGPWKLSRMTLTPMPNRHVRQVIERSRDGGESWSVAYESIYEPRGQITYSRYASPARPL